MENQEITTQISPSIEKGPIDSAAMDFLISDDAISSQQLNASDIISQAKGIRDGGVNAANAQRRAQGAGIENTFNTQIGNLNRNASDSRRAFAQGSSMGTSTAQYKVISDTINQNLKELYSARSAAELNADANQLSQINLMEVQYLQQKQQATSNLFSRMMDIAGIRQQQSSFQLQQRQQRFNEKETIGGIALQFGLEVQDGDDIDSIIGRAAPVVQDQIQRIKDNDTLDMEQKRANIKNTELQYEQIKASIATQRAQSREIAARINSQKSFSNLPESLIVDAAKNGTSPFELIKLGANPEFVTKGLFLKDAPLAMEDIRAELDDGGRGEEQIALAISEEYPNITQEKAALMVFKELQDRQKSTSSSKPNNLPAMFNSAVDSINKSQEDLYKFITGKAPKDIGSLKDGTFNFGR